MKRISTFLFAIFMAYSLFAQSPEKMSYQAVVRDINGNLITNETINMQISILQGSASGTAVYAETQSVLTNINGLLSIEIGMGDVQSGSFSAINWAEGPFFLKTETDPEGGTNYTITGISQLLSVPYALHAKEAESVANETDPVFSTSPAADVTQDDIVNLDNLSGVNTGDQNIGGIAENTQAIQDTAAQIRADIPDVNGFVTTEVDPVYTASEAANITAEDITNLGNLSGINTGDQDITGIGMNTQAIMDTAAQIRSDIPDVSGFITEEVDPVYTASEAANITAEDITNLGNLSGINTGDQDITGIGMNTQAIMDTAAQIRSDIPDVSGFITTEVDPVYTASEAANITAEDITNLGNLSGINTGDQDITGIGMNTQAIMDTAAQIRYDIPDVSGFIATEVDPLFEASIASHITSSDTAFWNGKSEFCGNYDSLTNAPNIANSSVEKTIQLNTNDETSSFGITKNNGTSVLKVDGSGRITGDGSGLSNVKPLIGYIGGNQRYQITANYGSFNDVRSVTIEVPSDGICFAMASGYVDWESTGWDLLLAAILCDQDPNLSWQAESEWYDYLNILTDYNCADSSDQYTSFAQHRCIPVSAGTHTFYLWANKYISSSRTEVGDVNLSVMFFPTGGVGDSKRNQNAVKKADQRIRQIRHTVSGN